MEDRTLRFHVESEAGVRLDRWLAGQMADRARNQIQHDIEAGRVCVGGVVRTAGRKVPRWLGDLIEYDLPEAPITSLVAESLPLIIILKMNRCW